MTLKFMACIGALVGLPWGVTASANAGAAGIAVQPPSSFDCPVTQPNGRGEGAMAYGNDALSTLLWPGGVVVFRPSGSGFVLADNALSMKFPWWRLRHGTLTIEGRRLDASAPPLRARIPSGYGNGGFQATSLIFPTTGCWEVTGHVGDASLTFVTRVEKAGAGQGE